MPIHCRPLMCCALAQILLLMCSGCTTSGYPWFVKFMPASGQILCEDNRYARVYVYSLESRKKLVLTGRVACIDMATNRFVLRAEGRNNPLPCSLVTLMAEGIRVESLPAVPLPGQLPQTVMEFGPSHGTIAALNYATDYDQKPSTNCVLTIGQSSWMQESIPEAVAGKPYLIYYRNINMRQGGYTFAPVHEWGPVVPRGPVWGVDVQDTFRNNKLGFRLPSPDGKYVVMILDPDDRLGRVTLTEVATGYRTVLLDKNDAAQDALDVLGRVYAAPLMILMGVGSI
jgi:hypothetical protein